MHLRLYIVSGDIVLQWCIIINQNTRKTWGPWAIRAPDGLGALRFWGPAALCPLCVLDNPS